MAFRLEFKISNLFDVNSETFFEEFAEYLNAIPQVNAVLNIKVDTVNNVKGICALHKKSEASDFKLNSLYAWRMLAYATTNFIVSGMNYYATSSTNATGVIGVPKTNMCAVIVINDNEDVMLTFYNDTYGHSESATTFFAETVEGTFQGISMGKSGTASNCAISYGATNSKESTLLSSRISTYNDKILVPFSTDADVFKRLYLAFNVPQETSVVYELDGKKYVEASKQSNMGVAMLYEG